MAHEIALPQTCASHPFDGSEVFDIILRTSDDVDFHIFRHILSIASPYFKAMFSLSQDSASDPRVVIFSEHSEIIDPLLRLCYPVNDPLISDLTQLLGVLDAATKYEMLEAKTILTRDMLHMFIPDYPLQVFAISCRLSVEEVASRAAKKWRELLPDILYRVAENDQLDSLDCIKLDSDGKIQPVDWHETITGRSYNEEMANISAGSFYRLLQFARTGIMTSFTGTSDIACSSGAPIKPTPLFNDADSDLTVMSSDGIEFKVHELILRLASPKILEQMAVDNEGNKSLLLPEPSSTIYVLLQGLYPSMTFDVSVNMNDISSALRASVKYKAAKKVVDFLKDRLNTYTHTNPLDVYFALVNTGFTEEAAGIAREIVLRFKQLPSLYVQAMESNSASSYYHLLHYRHRCLIRIIAVGSKYGDALSDRKLWDDIENWTSDSCFNYFPSSVIEKVLPTNGLKLPKLWAKRSELPRRLQEESIKVKKEIEESLYEDETWLKTSLSRIVM